MRQIYVIEPNGFAVANDGLFVGFSVFPFEQARAQDFECTVCGLGFLFAVNGLAEVAADTVGIIIEFFSGRPLRRLVQSRWLKKAARQRSG